MEKLVKLLNEYELKQVENAEWLDVSKVWIMDWTLHYYDNYKDDLVFDNIDLLIISARYWFIERLVENDKIDLDKVEQEAMGWFDDESPVYWKDIRTARLIMMLSVSNNPISDLVYYLK